MTSRAKPNSSPLGDEVQFLIEDFDQEAAARFNYDEGRGAWEHLKSGNGWPYWHHEDPLKLNIVKANNHGSGFVVWRLDHE